MDTLKREIEPETSSAGRLEVMQLRGDFSSQLAAALSQRDSEQKDFLENAAIPKVGHR